MDRSFYLLTYDIANDKRRARIAKAMESVGDRVQESVFEAYLTAAELEKALQRVAKVMNDKEDSLRIYMLCSACRDKVKTRGVGRVTPRPGVVVV